jgi:hypothetical protein
MRLALLSPLLLLAPLLALALPRASVAQTSFPEDLIGLRFDGVGFAIDSRSGISRSLGATGRTGFQASARQGDRIYAVETVTISPTSHQFFLDWIDDETGQATRTVQLGVDVRGLAPANGTFLMAIADAFSSDVLIRLNTLNGDVTVIGSTGFHSIQGFTRAGNQFYAWDLVHGLLRVDFLTGATVDVNPALGTGGAELQFLTTMSDGRVVGGRNAIYEIDLQTGAARLRGSGAHTDLRAGEERFGVHYRVGAGCYGAALAVSGSAHPGGTITTSSSGNRAFGFVYVMLGFSPTTFQGLPLPLRLDSLLGTSGCFLYAGPEITIGARADVRGNLSLQFPIPNLFSEGLFFSVQHAPLTSLSPAGIAFSNAIAVKIAL